MTKPAASPMYHGGVTGAHRLAAPGHAGAHELFGYFALQRFSFGRRQAAWNLALRDAVARLALASFTSRNAPTRPCPILRKDDPAVVGFAEKNGIELPFTDYASARTVA